MHRTSCTSRSEGVTRFITDWWQVGNRGLYLTLGAYGQDPEVEEARLMGCLRPPAFLLTDEIIMAAPLRITDVTSGLLGGEDGRVYIYNGKDTSLGDMTGKCKSWMSPCPEEKVKGRSCA